MCHDVQTVINWRDEAKTNASVRKTGGAPPKHMPETVLELMYVFHTFLLMHSWPNEFLLACPGGHQGSIFCLASVLPFGMSTRPGASADPSCIGRVQFKHLTWPYLSSCSAVMHIFFSIPGRPLSRFLTEGTMCLSHL